MAMHNPPHPGAKALGRSPESWLAMQHNYDLWQAKESTDLTQVRKVKFKAAYGAQIVDELSTKYVSVQSGLLKQPYGRE